MADPKTQALRDRLLQKLWHMQPPPSGRDATEQRAQSFAHGAGGNTGVPEQLAGALLDASRDSDNTYAGGTGDTLAKAGSDAAARYPKSNLIGKEAVATPAAAAATAALPAAALPARALAQAGIGALHGAYTAPDGERTRGAALGAGLSAIVPMAEGAAKAAFGRQAVAPAVAPAPASIDRVARRGPRASDIVPKQRVRLPDSAPATLPRQPTMLPPESDEALDASYISGIPEAKLPLEATGKYRVDLGPTHMQPPDSPAQWKVRTIEQQALARQARDLPPGVSDSGMRERGQSLFDALQSEPNASRTMLPTMPAEYSEPAVTQMPTLPDDSFGDLRLDEVLTKRPPTRASQISVPKRKTK